MSGRLEDGREQKFDERRLYLNQRRDRAPRSRARTRSLMNSQPSRVR
ncbi:hypothetical protein TSAR_009375 [Trichomalopsis sarcophagae]|uniref:Uncharacterized protein n=1 Tax=Trichomalopsis sarcophagae TaxID=543379 RepID=A0A232FG25_9HYME|nr:hypothetical protein TSAR_009375 [Trichomalopsis sarcophagae]